MKAEIVECERGPQIAGTRITVYSILDYLKEGWHHTRIASFFRISSAQVLAAAEYIASHREEVEADYQRILQRNKDRKNPPEIEALHKQSRAKLQAELRRRKPVKPRRPKNAGAHGR